MKHTLLRGLGATLLASTLLVGAVHAQSVKVSVTAIVEHPALDATRDGVRDALAEAGYKDGENLIFTYESAQGSPATAAQIARQFVGEEPDVIVPISTPSAQAMAAATSDIAIVFTAVTDPLGAQLVSNMDKPGANITGLSDMSPVAEHIALVQEVIPSLKTLGVIYNPGEANSVSLVSALKVEAEKAGVVIKESTSIKSADVQQAARALVGKVDAIYIPTDNTVISALEAVIAVGEQNNLPIFTGDTDSVARGAVASVGFNYYDIGKQTGAVVVRILKGEKPGDISVLIASGTDLVVNPGAAARMGITLPEALVARANKIIE
ncbi:MAG: ABC transporter permease [Hyphomicrobiales bacterium]|nr:MAG: ABC transporter permease [Hyphomicrobiales bacterium]